MPVDTGWQHTKVLVFESEVLIVKFFANILQKIVFYIIFCHSRRLDSGHSSQMGAFIAVGGFGPSPDPLHACTGRSS